MEFKQLKGAIEAIIFASGEPVEAKKIASVVGADAPTVMLLTKQLADFYDEHNSALRVIRIEDKFQMCAREEYAPYIREILEIRKNAPLSQAAMEVLAVIAYNQPVTKAFVEQVRGVDCSGVMGSLVQKELLEEKGRLELPGRPILYGVTDNFLRCFSLDSLESLPVPPDNQISRDCEDMDLSTAAAVADSEQESPVEQDELAEDKLTEGELAQEAL